MIYENSKLEILFIFTILSHQIYSKTCQTLIDCQPFQFQGIYTTNILENAHSNQIQNSVGDQYCFNNLCVSCIDDYHCKENSKCIQNKCTCLDDADCSNNLICNLGFCHPMPNGCNSVQPSQSELFCTSCNSGYSLIANKCIPECGDGFKVFGLEQCDDGNKENGDGCNSNCEIEQGWECEPNTPEKIDICKKKFTSERILEKTETNQGFEMSFDGYSISLLGAIGLTALPLVLSGKEFGAFLRQYGNIQSIMIMKFFSTNVGKEFELLSAIGGVLFWNFIPNPFPWFGISFKDFTDKNIPKNYSDIGLTKIFLRDYSQILLLFVGAIAIELATRFLLLCFKKSKLLKSINNLLGISFIIRFLLLNPLITLIPAFLQIFSINSQGLIITISIIASVCVFCFYIGILLVLILKQQKVITHDSEQEEIESQKTSIFFESHSNIHRTGVLSFYFWQILRAISVSLVITILESSPKFQIGSHTLITIIYLLFLVKLRPFKESKENTRQIGLETGVTIISSLFLASLFFDNEEIISAINGSIYVVIIGYFAFSFLLMVSMLLKKSGSDKKKSATVHTQKTSETMMEINKFNHQDTSDLDISKYPTKSCSHKASQEIISVRDQPQDDKPKLDLTNVLNSIDLKRELARFEKENKEYNSRPPRDLKRYTQPEAILHKKFASQSSIEVVSASVSDFSNSIDGVVESAKEPAQKIEKILTPISIQSDQSPDEGSQNVAPLAQKGTYTESEISLETLNAIEAKSYSKKKMKKPLADITQSVSENTNIAPIFVMECENSPQKKNSEVRPPQMLVDQVIKPKEFEDYQEIQLDENPVTQTDSFTQSCAQLNQSNSKKFNFQLDFTKLHKNLDRERIHRKLLEAIIPKKYSQAEIDKLDIL